MNDVIVQGAEARTYALVVGIEQYKAGKGWFLDGAASDALRFVDWLRKREHVPPENIELLITPVEKYAAQVKALLVDVHEAKRHEIREALARIGQAGNGGRLFVFWAGHGTVTLHRQKRHHVFCGDHTPKVTEAIELGNLLDVLRTAPWSRFREQICFFDICANYFNEEDGTGFDHMNLASGKAGGKVRQSTLIAACEGELAHNDTLRRTGSFSDATLKFLDELNGPLRAEALFRRLQEHFEALRASGVTEQHPVFIDWNVGDQEVRDGDVPNSRDTIARAKRSLVSTRLWRHAAREILCAFPALEQSEVMQALGRYMASAAGEPIIEAGRTSDAPTYLMNLLAAYGSALGPDALKSCFGEVHAETVVQDCVVDIVLSARSASEWSICLREAFKRTRKRLDSTMISTLYMRSVGLVMPRRRPPPDELDDALFRLTQGSTLHSDELLPPLEQFLLRAAREFGDDEFVTSMHQRLQLDPEQVENTERAIAADARGEHCVHLLLDMHYLESGELEKKIRYWLIDKYNPRNNFSDDLSTDGSEASLFISLVKLVETARKLAPENVHIEIYVPNACLSARPDEWQLPYALWEEKLGTLAGVALRWRERAMGAYGTGSDDWERIAARIRALKAGMLDVEWISRETGGARVVGRIRDEHFAACCNFDFFPLNPDQRRPLDERLARALNAGMPFAIWPRGEVETALFRDKIGKLLELPEAAVSCRIWQARCDAQTVPDVCTDLTLFWDDPLRNPLRWHYSETTQKGTTL
ncbi:hypothetical protein CBA19CS11_35820 [Caballeronia novacaledonica]|nr:hypothetical protein CBA19CS11_35820 [Caballeronia novacaledonica]